ncbi:hypothetical protein J6590_075285 [Homalodisca vitripennis]|nr:hypothetical protein J6590_075285 [Homalodisca vitripennis]
MTGHHYSIVDGDDKPLAIGEIVLKVIYRLFVKQDKATHIIPDRNSCKYVTATPLQLVSLVSHCRLRHIVNVVNSLSHVVALPLVVESYSPLTTDLTRVARAKCWAWGWGGVKTQQPPSAILVRTVLVPESRPIENPTLNLTSNASKNQLVCLTRDAKFPQAVSVSRLTKGIYVPGEVGFSMGMLFWAVTRALFSTISPDGHALGCILSSPEQIQRSDSIGKVYAGVPCSCGGIPYITGFPVPFPRLATVWATDPKARDHREKELWLPSSAPLGAEHGIGHTG